MAQPVPAPRKIAKFEILDRLGQGGMGTVYKARDPGLDRLVALKTILPGLLQSEEAKERFYREARAVARLQHPNIVTVFEAGDFEGTLFIAMELLEGQDLAQVLQVARSVEEKVKIVVEVCHGLDYAHKRGVIHRDIKPANIRLLPNGSVKIVDFGIARLGESHMTQTGLVLGTPSYLAPEVLAGGRVDHRADMWAVGIVLYELLAGRKPYASPTFVTLAYQIVHEPLPPLDDEALGLPPGLWAVVAKALAKSPSDRYADLAEMAAALVQVLGLQVAGDTPLSEEARRRSYQVNLEEAKRRLAVHDLERALEAARRAQAVEPSGTEVVGLLEGIEARLASAEAAPTVLSVPDDATVASTTATPTPSPTAVVTQVRTRGAAVYRDLGTFGEPPATQTAAFSPVEDVLALAGSDGAVRLWDLGARRRLAVLRTEMHRRAGHDARAVRLAFSPDGKLLAVGHVDGSIHLFDLTREEELPVKLRHEDMVSALAFSPNGKTLASGGTDATLKLWGMEGCRSGDPRRELHRQPSAITALAYAGGGRWLVTAHTNRTLRVLDAATVRLTATLRGPEAPVTLLRADPQGRLLVAGSQDRLLRVFDLESKESPISLGPFRKPLTAARFFADGRHLVTVGLENVVQIWDLDSRTAMASLYGATDEAFVGVALFGAGEHLAAALTDGRVRLWGPA
jgi:predicted Ser/Thr protein kinase